MNASDFLVVGGGVIGINIARELKRRYPDASLVLIEKEPECGLHASGRNSGVLHAGFYYTADSMKAKFTRTGNQALTDYCEERGLAINKCGKLVVAKDEHDLPQLAELLKRAKNNGVPLEEISEAEAREIEPRVLTHQRALYSPSTASVDPVAVVQAMKSDAIAAGIAIHHGVRYLKHSTQGVHTSNGLYRAGYVVNAAGLYADKIAKDYGYSDRYEVLPFKGLYLYSSEPAGSVRTNIYPVPDLRNPFLGVHFTLTVDGHIKIGPTAIPAFWREQYHGYDNFSAAEFINIFLRQAGLLIRSDFDFHKLAVTELMKYSRRRMAQLAAQLLRGVRLADYKKWGRPGIRAQLLDKVKRKLEMDFVLEGDDRSMHVLNAVSPAFTCSIPFSRYVCDEIARKLK